MERDEAKEEERHANDSEMPALEKAEMGEAESAVQ